MDPRREWKIFAALAAAFLACWFLPVGIPRFDGAVLGSLDLVRSYAREHVVTCLLPALFIAGGISVFVRQASVLRWLGPDAPRATAYGVASISGTILAVCSCTVLPLFAGIYRAGAGLGPASAFLYSGPAINVLAIVLTARVLGTPLGTARAAGAVAFSLVIGLLMHMLFRSEEETRVAALAELPAGPAPRPLHRTALTFAALVAILVFANWSRPEGAAGFFATIGAVKWWLTGASAAVLLVLLSAWYGLAWWKALATAVPPAAVALAFPAWPVLAFGAALAGLTAALATSPGELRHWLMATWEFTKQIVPLLLGGVVAAGLLFGAPGGEGLVPSSWIASWVGGNSVAANLLASLVGALMYFATLTEIPILQGLRGSGMGDGPALALLLAGPALSLPSILVLRGILGWRKTLAYVGLVVALSAAAGVAYGALASLTGWSPP